MPFIPIPNGVSLCFDFVSNGQSWQFCLNLRKSAGAPTPTDLAGLTATGSAWWTSHLQDLVNSGTQLAQVRATDMTAQGAPQDIQSVLTDGDLANTPLPLNAAIVISQRTAKRGRSYRGRAYLSGLDVTKLSSVTDVTSAFATALVTAFTALQSTLDGLGFDMVVASKQHNGVTTNPADANEVIAFVVDTHFDSQRRRLFGRGA